MRKTTQHIIYAAFGLSSALIVGLTAIAFIKTGIQNPYGISTPMLTIAAVILSLVLSFPLQVILHEAGHLVMGLLCGYGFVSFRIFSYVLVSRKQGLKVARYQSPGTFGETALDPPERKEDGSYPLLPYCYGGVLMNFLTALLSALALTFTQDLILRMFLLLMILTGLFLIISNGIPAENNGYSNDAKIFEKLSADHTLRDLFFRNMKAEAALQQGERPSMIPDSWITDQRSRIQDRSDIGITARMHVLYQMLDQRRISEARKMAEEVMDLTEEDDQTHFDARSALLLLEAITAKRKTAISTLMDKPTRRILNAQSPFDPIKDAALELSGNPSGSGKEEVAARIRESRERYLHPGLSDTVLDLIGRH